MYRKRKKGENQLDFMIRRIKQWVRPPNANPIHGTPSHATSSWLELLGYELIYPNEENLWYCICDMVCTYVLDIQIPGDHTTTVHQRIAYTTAPFNPDETDVVNVHRLSSERTEEFKLRAQYKRDEETWFREWMASGGIQLLDWETRPKLEDYLPTAAF